MSGPVHKPVPLMHPADIQAREEMERLKALDDAQQEREAEFEARIEAAEFLPIDTADVERVELEAERMKHDPDPNEVYHDRYRGVFE